MRQRKHLFWIVAVLALTGVGCSFANTEPDEVACAYGGGLFEAKTRKGQYEPGSGRDFVGMMDTVIELPANVRNFIIEGNNPEADAPEPVITPSADGVEMMYEANVRFRLNTDLACDFWEEHGKRFDVNTDEGWRLFLQQNLYPILVNRIKEQSQRFEWEAAWRNQELPEGGSVWTVMQDNIGEAVVTEVNRSLGGQYLCGVTWEPGGESCPPFEVLLKTALPRDTALTQRYTNIQAREAEREEQRVVKETEREAIELNAQNQLAEAEAQVAVARAELEVEQVRAEADAQLCRELAEIGVDCALYAASQSGRSPLVWPGSESPSLILPTE